MVDMKASCVCIDEATLRHLGIEGISIKLDDGSVCA